MKTITISINDQLYSQIEEKAREASRQTSELISEALTRLLDRSDRAAPSHSVVDIKSYPLGPPVKPWTTRAEMLEGFMDDRG